MTSTAPCAHGRPTPRSREGRRQLSLFPGHSWGEVEPPDTPPDPSLPLLVAVPRLLEVLQDRGRGQGFRRARPPPPGTVTLDRVSDLGLGVLGRGMGAGLCSQREAAVSMALGMWEGMGFLCFPAQGI